MIIRALARTANIIPKRMKNRLMTMLFLPMPWLEIKIAEKQLFLISLPEQSEACRQLSGVTVDRKDGVIKGYPKTLVTDLPGIYSMSPFSARK